jgi:hypothetical protein
LLDLAGAGKRQGNEHGNGQRITAVIVYEQQEVVTGVLLADGWHECDWFGEPGDKTSTFELRSVGERFLFEEGDHTYEGPASSILAIRYWTEG